MTEPVARLRIELREIEPRLWRRVDVPLSSTLLALHDIIQAVVGWTDSHIFIESVRDGEADVDYPAFVDGERRCPPEDVGGATGFMQFLAAALDPLHEEHDEVVTWYGKPFDPVDIDERWVRPRLATLAARRRGALMRHRGATPPDST